MAPVRLHLSTYRNPPRSALAVVRSANDVRRLVASFVVAEALTNVAEQARSTGARVTVAAEADLLVLEVGDGGVGAVDHRRGSGLTGPSDRVDALNGTPSVASTAVTGTTVRVTLPMSDARPRCSSAADGRMTDVSATACTRS